MASTKVQGREALKALLKRLTPAVSAALQGELNARANDLADLMRSRASVRSGALKSTIRVEPFTRGDIGVAIRAGGPATTKPVKRGKSAKYDYAAANELGTQEMLAQPFFYPSYRQKKAGIIRGTSTAVQKAVKTIT